MAKFTRIVNGILRSYDEGSALPIYDEPLTIVASGAGANEMNGPVITGTAVTLPASGTYEGEELEVRLNGQRLEGLYDYNYVGSGTKTQVSFTFNLSVGDRLDFRVDRAA